MEGATRLRGSVSSSLSSSTERSTLHSPTGPAKSIDVARLLMLCSAAKIGDNCLNFRSKKLHRCMPRYEDRKDGEGQCQCTARSGCIFFSTLTMKRVL